MEARKVIIINNKTQSQKTIMSHATTLGELKAEAVAAGVNISDMTWYEGHLRAEIKDDNAELPVTVMYRGQETTELTFLLTQPDKKVKSGTMTRVEAYNAIKKLNLVEECKNAYGRSFTQCSTKDLIALIEEAQRNTNTSKKEEFVSKDIFLSLVEALFENGYLEDYQYSSIVDSFEEDELSKNNKMSKEDIDNMFSFVL